MPIFTFFPTHEEHPSWIKNWTWMTCSGPHVGEFLHRLSTVHVKNLALGHGSPGCFLNAQAKILFYFTLWYLDPQTYALEWAPGQSDSRREDFFSFIDQNTFIENISFQEHSVEKTVWIFLDPSEQTEETKQKPGQLESLLPYETRFLVEYDIRICHHGARNYGRPWMTLWGRADKIDLWIRQNQSILTALSWVQLEEWRIFELCPGIDTEMTKEFTPLDLGLEEAIALQKGCYPGQEVIQRIYSQGSPAYRLILIQSDDFLPQRGGMIWSVDSIPVELGTVTSCSPQVQRVDTRTIFYTLGVIRKTHAIEGQWVQFMLKTHCRGKIIKVSAFRSLQRG